MKKRARWVSVLLVTVLLICAVPLTAQASDYTPAHGESFDMSACTSGDTVTIKTGRYVSLVNSLNSTLTNVRIICEEGATVILQGVKIDNSAFPGVSPITFTGTGNTLGPLHTTTNILIGGENAPAILVEGTTELTITEYGTLNATGGANAAGIGGRNTMSCGTIYIDDPIINAVGGMDAAGIGGGAGGDGGAITLTRTTYYSNITATGTGGGAGIGGGAGGAGGSLEVIDGTVMATGNYGAGIGGGAGGTGGTVAVSGGIVTAGSIYGAAIGGGGGAPSGGGGDVTLTGGAVRVSSSFGADIGGGYNTGTSALSTAGGTLTMDNAAGLTLGNNGTNAAFFPGDCIIAGAGAGPHAGVYFDGVLYTSAEAINMAGTSSGAGYTYTSPAFTINTDGEYLIWETTTTNRVVVAPGVDADIFLFGTNIQLAAGCALDMSGATADIELFGINTLKSGTNYAGLQCPDGAALTISGDGTINASSVSSGAGIGGGNLQKGGVITILSGTINAKASTNSIGNGGAGIGGGAGGACGVIRISGGTITATGGNPRRGVSYFYQGMEGAAITISGGTILDTGYTSSCCGIGGYSNAGSTIKITGGTILSNGRSGGPGIGGKGTLPTDVTITGGTINANGGHCPGIGGAYLGGVGTINISGGTVIATGGYACAGIGGRYALSSGVITISGGTVFASAGAEALDIGSGPGSTGGTLTIEGTAQVFLKHDTCITPTTQHTHLSYPGGTAEVYGADVPDTWTDAFGAYLLFYDLSYNANNSSGTVPAAVKQYVGTAAAVSYGSGLSKENYAFSGWNTAADGSGEAYGAGSSFTFLSNATLYAQWKAVPKLACSDADATIFAGGSFTLTPNIAGGTWSFDPNYLSINGTVLSAFRAGTTRVTYTVGGQSINYDITIKSNALPYTGQNFLLVYIFAGVAVLLAIFTIFLCKPNKKV